MTVTLRAGEASLSDWRSIWRGEPVALDPACRPAVAASADAVRRILERGEAVYGVNTGFGKLARVRIADADLAQLQRNIVLSHSAGVGEAASPSTTRLMMALKLASLAQGASGIQPRTLALLEAMLARGVLPVVPSQGSAGASGDLAPLAHMAAAMIGVGEARIGERVAPAAAALAEAGLAPIDLAPKEGLALLNGTQFSTANALVGLFEAEALLRSALAAGALSTDAARGSDTPFDPRIHALRRHRGQIEVAACLARAPRRKRDSRLASDRRRSGPGPLLPSLPAAGDGRLPRPVASGRRDARRRSQWRHRQSADLRRSRRGAFGRKLSRRAGRLRRRHDRAGDLRNRFSVRAADRDAGRSGLVRPSGVLDAEARPELRLDDRAGDGGRADLGKQAARLSGERRLDPDVRQPGGSCLDGRAWRAPIGADGGERLLDHRHRTPRRRPGLRFSCAARLQRAARGPAGAAASRGSASRRGPISSSGHSGRDPDRAQRRRRRCGRRRRAAGDWKETGDDGRPSGLARGRARRGAAHRQHSA